MKAARRFVVLTIPRTGSNYLCSLLNAHPQVLCHHEVWNASGIFCALDLRSRSAHYFGTVEERDREPLAFLERLWNRSFGRPVVGLKFCRGQNRAAFEALLADPAVRKIVMRRRNRVKTYVSEMIAQLTGEWESYPGSRLAGERIKIPVPAAGLFRHVEHNATYYDDVERRLARSGQAAVRLDYEDLCGDGRGRREALRAVFDFLEVDAGVAAAGLDAPRDTAAGDGTAAPAGATRKQNPSDLRQLIANFHELAAALRGSELEAELHAVDL
jgi:LPS sulfotransferase NodH